MIREVTVFSPGDSRSLTCWSNVPYLFTKSLENRGVKVNRVNIYSNKYIRKTIWKYLIAPVVNWLYKEHAYTYEQTSLNRAVINLKIKRALAKYKGSDLNIFISYDYLPVGSNVPNVLLCDWTAEYLYTRRQQKVPCKWEQEEIARQRYIIENADYVISLFPDIVRYMSERYKNRNIFYLEQNVINNAYEYSVDKNQIVLNKYCSQILLFIGREGYLEGARMLVQCFQELKKQYPKLELHIIGLTKNNFTFLPDNVYCYGYLDKSDDKDRACYYDLLLKAKVLINPTPLWAGYSSSVEAMYFYTPIVVSYYQSFVETFGEDISFGFYLKENKSLVLSELIMSILDQEESMYIHLCDAAHNAVKSFTWDSFVDKFLEKIEV